MFVDHPLASNLFKATCINIQLNKFPSQIYSLVFWLKESTKLKKVVFNRMGKEGETVVIDIRNCLVELFVTTDIADDV